MSDKPNFYSILTATVRYDNRLTDSEKILYSEITSLTQSTGECWASNSYFSELYKVTPQAISKRINKLMKYGYLTIEYEREKGQKNIKKRIIKLTDIGVSTTVDTYQLEIKRGINQRLRGYQPEVKENNTSINNTSNNNLYLAVTFSLKNGDDYFLTLEEYNKLKNTYAYDIDPELKKASLWLDSNPSRKKTEKGMFRFISGWLSRNNFAERKPRREAPVPEYQTEVDMSDQEEKALREKIKAMLEGNHESQS